MCPDTAKAIHDLFVELLALKARVEALEPKALASNPAWIPLQDYEARIVTSAPPLPFTVL